MNSEYELFGIFFFGKKKVSFFCFCFYLIEDNFCNKVKHLKIYNFIHRKNPDLPTGILGGGLPKKACGCCSTCIVGAFVLNEGKFVAEFCNAGVAGCFCLLK